MKRDKSHRKLLRWRALQLSVVADGPTRVLRFSDEPSTANVEDEQSILDLAARLKQVRMSSR